MIALIGSGNVASWIALRLQHSAKFPIGQVYSRNIEHARAIADRVGAEAIDDLSKLSDSADVYLFSLKDDAYATVLSQIPFKMPVALHTAGSVSQSIFETYAHQYGVLYPLQTFSKQNLKMDVKVPLCMETDHLDDALNMTEALAAELSDMCCKMNERQRSVVHLAAVFACNFSNAMFTIADDLLKADDMDINIMLPLIQQTVNKLQTMSPREAQTGPAVRKDAIVMEKQLHALTDPRWKEIYALLSAYILER